MLSAKLFDTSNNILNAIRRSHDERLHAASVNFRRVSMSSFTGDHLGAAFRAKDMSKFCKAYLLTGFKGKGWLVRGRVHVEASLSEGLQRIKPALFSFNLKSRKHQFQDFIREGLFTVLVPCILQFGVIMLIVSERIEVLSAAMAKINSTANVEFASNGAGDLVDARCLRDVHTNLFFFDEVKAVVS